MTPVKTDKKEVVEEFVPFDPWHPVLKNSPSLQTTLEQESYIREILDICCSDSAFAKKAYAAIQYVLTAEPPVAPTVTSLNPATAVVGDASFDLHVTGTGFDATSVILFNSIEEPTTLVSETELTTGVNMPIWTEPQTATVAVKNGDLTSAPVNFEFTAPILLNAPTSKKDLGPELKKEYEIKSHEEHKGQEKK